ncbi:tripartite tricarboxylate transporter TctB family protein [Xanthobacter autotrophicus]|uniref:tripartite tricarboxylate transporter TctB family protein n=1 Tax=Xanthobacter TaxID=279 RepID=UPI0024AACD9F|nr:tripartite tricarboxylate transporter TctB family protein [Xanthobacter autotrophicus]MDI4664068.1 tripartite tricarboxylate transporter TctB family protein [Xanthobacter autotrophicus]
MRFSDLFLGLVVLGGAALLFWAASGLPSVPGQSYGADTFPVLTAAGLAACGFILTVGAVRAGPFPLVEATWVREPGAPFRAGATIALVLAYLVLAPLLGFVLAATITLFGLFMLVRVRPVTGAAVAAVTALIIHLSFSLLLRVPLPRGLVEGLLP